MIRIIFWRGCLLRSSSSLFLRLALNSEYGIQKGCRKACRKETFFEFLFLSPRTLSFFPTSFSWLFEKYCHLLSHQAWHREGAVPWAEPAQLSPALEIR